MRNSIVYIVMTFIYLLAKGYLERGCKSNENFQKIFTVIDGNGWINVRR